METIAKSKVNPAILAKGTIPDKKRTTTLLGKTKMKREVEDNIATFISAPHSQFPTSNFCNFSKGKNN